jgi:hypothetical protein
LLRTTLTDAGINVATVDTVERPQGGEKPAIIVSGTESDPHAIGAAASFILSLESHARCCRKVADAIGVRWRIARVDACHDDRGRLKPEEVRGNAAQGESGKPVWYEWSEAHWGTKWNACHSSCKDEDGSLVCFFDTAWAPPEPVWKKLGEIFPALDFEINGSSIESDIAFDGSIKAGQLEQRKVPLILTVTDPKTGKTVTGTSAEVLARWELSRAR